LETGPLSSTPIQPWVINSEAERDAQWILDLRRASALGFEKAAGLRELFGDDLGAIEFYGEALTRTAQSDLDQRAWLLTQKARLTLRRP
jgi:hypothetical protein